MKKLTWFNGEHIKALPEGTFGKLALPYLRILIPGLVMLFGFVAMIELLSFLTIGMAEGKHLALFGHAIDVLSAIPWLIAGMCLVAGSIWLASEARTFRRVWSSLMESTRQA